MKTLVQIHQQLEIRHRSKKEGRHKLALYLRRLGADIDRGRRRSNEVRELPTITDTVSTLL